MMLVSRAIVATVALVVFSALANAQSQALAWGDNVYGQCGVPSAIGPQVYTKLTAGDRHTIGLRVDGHIDAWGDNFYGQLNVPPLPAGLTYVDIASGPLHNLALRSNGTAVGWGENFNGKCNVPAPPPGVTYVRLACGQDHSLAARSDGQVSAWGANGYGETSVPMIFGAVDVAAGYGHSLALMSDGSIIGWGYNNIGQASPPAHPPGVPYTDFSTGAVHGAALRSDGLVTTWGYNGYGQCTVASRLTQTVFEILENGRTAPHSNLSAWLRAWYWSVRKDYLRDRRKHQRSRPLADDTEATPHSPEMDAAELQELRLALQQCLAQLPEVQRNAILLRYGDERSVADVQSMFHTQNPNTIRVWVLRGMIALRTCLTQRGVAL